MENKIAPGYKDSGKDDDGLGDIIIWNTLLEIGSDKKSDVVFVSNDQKSDWFYKHDRLALYPKYELLDEFRRTSKGKTLHIISFTKFLEIQNANPKTLVEMKKRFPKIFILILTELFKK